MIEPIMYFGIGFLLAALMALAIIPAVHGRAVRLTRRRLEAALPQSMLEVQAEQDQLRAQFAMSTRRLEIKVEQLKNKIASQLVELGKKDVAINRFRIERNTQEVEINFQQLLTAACGEAKAEVIPLAPNEWPTAELGRAWTTAEVRELKSLAGKKTPTKKIARTSKRSKGATRQKAFSMGLSLESRM